jgi:hypothetical protein
MGGYFAVRPALLPEDARFMGTTPSALLEAAPGLSRWLKRVFWVMGGYIAATGVLVVYVANTGLRSGGGGALAVLTVAWAVSMGWMAVVNVLIDSDFKLPLRCPRRRLGCRSRSCGGGPVKPPLAADRCQLADSAASWPMSWPAGCLF